jgi:hypothetical protein
MRVGSQLLELAQAERVRSIFVVGTGRDVGKTTTLRAIYDAACDARISTGLASIGRDGETSGERDAAAKPRLWLRPGTIFVTARGSLPRTPAAQILALSRLQSAAGPLLYARVAAGGYYELVGPPTASGIREIVADLSSRCEMTIVDGAVDRIAALAGSAAAVVVAGGAAAAATMQEAVDEIAALVARLCVPAADASQPVVELDGALTAAAAARFIAERESRQIVVRDPTQIALSGRAASQALAALRIRCRRPLRVLAVSVASIAGQRTFEPAAFARAVAASTGCAVFDVYAARAA